MIPSKSVQLLQQAYAHLMSGRLDTALAEVRKVVRKHPRWDRALYLNGLCHIRKGDHTQAEQWFKKALAANPDMPEALTDLGNIYLMAKNFEKAEGLYAKALRMCPDHPDIMSSQAICINFLRGTRDALPLARAAVRVAPQQANVWSNLGQILKVDKAWDEALDAFDKALTLNPNYFPAVEGLLKIAEWTNRLGDYRDLLKRAQKAAPDNLDFQLMGAHLLRREESPEAAVDYLDDLISNSEARLQDLQGQDWRKNGDLLRRHRTEIEMVSGALSKFYAERGALLDSLGDYERAFSDFVACNEASKIRHPYWKDAQTSFLRGLETLRGGFAGGAFDFLGEPIRGSEQPTKPNILFEVGFPRSGTTLLESFLDAHPQCAAMDETPALAQTLAHMKIMGRRYPDDLAALTDAEVQELQDTYMRLASSFVAEKGMSWIIDKNPLNMIHVGFIRRIFPAARILLVVRHPLDCGLSCFMQNFAINGDMANFLCLEDTFAFYDNVFRLWNSYAERLADDVALVMRYEDVVEDKEGQIARLFQWLGLDGSTQHTSAMKTTTPSYRQINQPIYRQGLARWKRYECQLRPHVGTVAVHMENFGYIGT